MSQPIHMVGHSRGGYIVMEVARELQDKGICCNWKVYNPRVRFMGLYDPVDMTAGYGKAETVSANVERTVVILASGKPGGRWLSNLEYARSQEYFNRADEGPEHPSRTNYSDHWVFAMHAAIGGDPWGGDHPLGHSEGADIRESINVDEFVRQEAEKIGVPISPLAKGNDYGYQLGYIQPKARTRR